MLLGNFQTDNKAQVCASISNESPGSYWFADTVATFFLRRRLLPLNGMGLASFLSSSKRLANKFSDKKVLLPGEFY
jgi:hypothetical protein